ncbi:TRAF-type zinc finger domain-containing protein 1 isoform X2 [Echinops telfairi]|uniref:TRAF-type zinc finger domain-containing protein 1 isoform X2 n=1 Tax=Echinops telfairi TaxID=9371 RepID=A0AC55DLS7_ECHTE|nr:TRAF-type zinc finger domain-containing protein 1 isoform X2 [Echinops telfairi]
MAEFLDDQDTRLCDNCKKEIPVFNFTIHEIHCQRNIGVCPVCKEPYPKSDMETHVATEHCQVTCKCNKKLEKRQLKTHEETECPLRPALCQHCDLELSVLRLKEHEDYCGARTERCGNCGRNVLVKDLKTHPGVCGQEGKEKEDPVALPPNAAADPWGQHGMWIASHLLRQMEALDPPMRLPRRPLQCFDAELLHSRTTNQRNMATQFPIQNNLCAAGETLLPCEFCEELYPEELLIDHQTSCNPSCALPPFSTGRSSPKVMERPDNVFQKFLQQANELESLMGLTSSPPVEESIIIPCEFCGVQLEEEVLFHHQDQCDQRPATANNQVTEGFPRQDSQPPETSPELPRRRVRHQGDLPTSYMELIKQEEAKGPTYPLPPNRPMNSMTTPCNRMSRVVSGPRPGGQPSPPRVLKLNNSDSQDIPGQNCNSHNGALGPGHISAVHPVRNLYPEALVSFPRGPGGRYGASGRSEGGRNSRVNPPAASYRNRTTKAQSSKQQGAGDTEEEEEEE